MLKSLFGPKLKIRESSLWIIMKLGKLFASCSVHPNSIKAASDISVPGRSGCVGVEEGGEWPQLADLSFTVIRFTISSSREE